jgi:hypothetical protein
LYATRKQKCRIRHFLLLLHFSFTKLVKAPKKKCSSFATKKMNFLDIYENACTACGVRPNSLLHKTLRDAPIRPITHLRLADNYVGPKGFLALVPLIEKCQTLETLDLRGNGLDNSSIIALCRVLRSSPLKVADTS